MASYRDMLEKALRLFHFHLDLSIPLWLDILGKDAFMEFQALFSLSLKDLFGLIYQSPIFSFHASAIVPFLIIERANSQESLIFSGISEFHAPCQKTSYVFTIIHFPFHVAFIYHSILLCMDLQGAFELLSFPFCEKSPRSP